MKRGFLIAVYAIIIIVFLIGLASYSIYIKEKKDAITGKAVTGKATDANFAVSVSVIVGAPSVSILSPENKTYISGTNLWLNYSASSNVQSVWYSLDGSANKTVAGNTTFNASTGPHTIFLYANNSDGINASANTTFTVNISRLTIYYSNYSGSKRGSSTDFNMSPYEDLQNLSGIVLENTDYGKILFSQPINITNDVNPVDGSVNIDVNTNISSNHIEVNTAGLPNFNTSAILYLYNLTFSNPMILRDGAACPDSICTKISYSGGTLIFAVTQFSAYSAEETPSSPPPGGGGPGGGSLYSVQAFDVNTDQIYIKLQQGETKGASFIIKNTGTYKENITIQADNQIGEFMKINDSSFQLDPGNSRYIGVDFFARTSTAPDVYIGKITITSGKIVKEILIAIDIESAQGLFDVNVNIPNQYLTVQRGHDVMGDVHIYNLGKVDRIDADVEYTIKSPKGDIIANQTDTVAVGTQAEYLKTLHIPEGADPGKYLFYVRITYNSQVASSGAFFVVTGEMPLFGLINQLPITAKIYIAVSLLIIISIVILIIILKRRREMRYQVKF